MNINKLIDLRFGNLDKVTSYLVNQFNGLFWLGSKVGVLFLTVYMVPVKLT